jgi:hypothetical protein
MCFEIVEWTHLAQDDVKWRTFANMIMDVRSTYSARKYLISCITISFSVIILPVGIIIIIIIIIINILLIIDKYVSRFQIISPTFFIVLHTVTIPLILNLSYTQIFFFKIYGNRFCNLPKLCYAVCFFIETLWLCLFWA